MENDQSAFAWRQRIFATPPTGQSSNTRAVTKKGSCITFELLSKRAELRKILVGGRAVPRRNFFAVIVNQDGSRTSSDFQSERKDRKLDYQKDSELMGISTTPLSKELCLSANVTMPSMEIEPNVERATISQTERASAVPAINNAVATRKERSNGRRISEQGRTKRLERKITDQRAMLRGQAERISRLEAWINRDPESD